MDQNFCFSILRTVTRLPLEYTLHSSVRAVPTKWMRNSERVESRGKAADTYYYIGNSSIREYKDNKRTNEISTKNGHSLNPLVVICLLVAVRVLCSDTGCCLSWVNGGEKREKI